MGFKIFKKLISTIKSKEPHDSVEIFGETYESEPNTLIAHGRYHGKTFYVMNRYVSPCAYIDVTGTSLDGKTAHDLYDIKCHGGITWADNAVSGLEHEGSRWYIGWDYAHSGDWNRVTCISGRKWSVAEIIEECHEVIDGLGSK